MTDNKVIIATSGLDQLLRFWDASQGKVMRGIDMKTEQAVHGLSISPDTRLVAAINEKSVKFVPAFGLSVQISQELQGHRDNVSEGGWISSALFPGTQESGLFWTVSEDKTARIWNVATSKELFSLPHPTALCSGALHPGQRVLFTGDYQGCLRAWDLIERKTICELQLFEQDVAVKALASGYPVPEQGKEGIGTLVVVGNRSGHIWVYAEDPNCPYYLRFIQEVEAHESYVLHCCFSSDAHMLATCGADHICCLWEVDPYTGHLTELRKLGGSVKKQETVPVQSGGASLPQENRQTWIYDCCFSRDAAYVLTGSSDGYAKLWRWDNGQDCPVRYFVAPTKSVLSVALHDGSHGSLHVPVPECRLPREYLARLESEAAAKANQNDAPH